MKTNLWFPGVSRYQWLVLLVAWLGWVFDAMDATIYALVLHPALQELLPDAGSVAANQAAIAWHGGIIFSIFLIGWAAGGVMFGVVADRIGRTKTLIITIIIYAVFTGLASVAGNWQELALYRFLTALGIGGEWAAGATLVAEVWPEAYRAKAAGLLQSAWAAGFLLAAVITLLLRDFGWRPIFVVGVVPALVAMLIRCSVKEPERWVRVTQEKQAAPRRSRVSELFSPALRRQTLVGAGLAFVAVFGLWGATNWVPTLVRALPELQNLSAGEQTARVSWATMLLNAGALGGYLSFGPIAEKFGRRPAFAVMCVGSLVMLPLTFLAPTSFAQVLLLLPFLGFFNNGIFSGFPLYFPELYPTRLRATGAGFCFNIGRVLASAGPLLTGILVAALGSFNRAASAVAVIYAAGLLVLLVAPETRGKPLPD